MKILLVGADRTNPTDGVIVQGIMNLLKAAYNEFEHEYIFLDDHNIMSISDIQCMKNFDLIVVCGTPWLWDNFQKSVKYDNLKFIFHIHDKAKKIFMGIGTCINLQDIDSEILKRPEEIQGMTDLFMNSTIIVRDHLTRNLLDNAEIESILLPCPAYFCYNAFNFSTKENNVMIWCDPQKTISSSNWTSNQKLNDYCNIFLEFYKQYNPEVYCAFPEEIELAVKIGLPSPKVLFGYQNTMDIMGKANHVLSGRVHCAIPAKAAGCNTTLVPLDTRAYTFDISASMKDKDEYINILKGLT